MEIENRYDENKTPRAADAGFFVRRPTQSRGTLAAVDLTSGEVRWKVPIGEDEGQVRGLPNNGGPMVTAGGLDFLGATMDNPFRVFDIDSGKVLWSTELPRSAFATPMTYSTNGNQYVVIAVGGHGKMGLPTGDYVMAFALP